MTVTGKAKEEEKTKSVVKETYESPSVEIEGNLKDITAGKTKGFPQG